MWSRAVQMGSGGCVKVFENIVKDKGINLAKASNEDIIRAIYEECARLDTPKGSAKKILAKDGDDLEITGQCLVYFSSSKSDVQAGVYDRLVNKEIKEALELLKKFG